MTADWPTAASWLASGSSDGEALVVAGVPLRENAVTPCRYDLAPAAVRARLERLSTYDADHGVDLRDVPVRDLGDALAAPELTAPLTVLLGGHNGVTFEALRGRADLADWGVVTFDAHHDVRPYDDVPGNGSPIRALIDSGVPGDHVVQVGIHGFCNSPVHRRWCEDHGITVLPPAAITRVGELLDALSERCRHVYVDVDLDVLDAAFAPGCPGARPGGVRPRDLFEAAFAAGLHPAVRAVDIVELDPTRDVQSVTTDAGALVLLSAAAGFGRRPAGAP